VFGGITDGGLWMFLADVSMFIADIGWIVADLFAFRWYDGWMFMDVYGCVG